MKPNRRKTIPWKVKCEAALRALGLTIREVNFDHEPALALREWDERAQDTIPPANDPDFIRILLVADHKAKTFGRGGEKRVTTLGSDIHAIAKARRLSKEQEEFRRRLLSREPGEKRERKNTIRNRGFDKSRKHKLDGTIVPRTTP